MLNSALDTIEVSELPSLKLQKRISSSGTKDGARAIMSKLQKIIVCAASMCLYFFLVRGFRIVQVESISMEKTLYPGDILLVSSGGSIFEAIHRRTCFVCRNDIVVFRSPEDPSTLLTKRVVAIGGDRVRINADQLFVNDRRCAEPYVQHINHPASPQSWPIDVDSSGERDVVVPRGQFFALGDNRDASDDSRFWGSVPISNVVGVLEISIHLPVLTH